MPDLRLTQPEIDVMDLLGQAMNQFAELEEIHGSDRPEFAKAIHDAQNIVLARPGMKQYQIHKHFLYPKSQETPQRG